VQQHPVLSPSFFSSGVQSRRETRNVPRINPHRLLPGRVIVVGIENPLPRIRTVQHMKDDSARGRSFGSSHDRELYRFALWKSIKGS
jgi:hypothetical protein